MGVTWLAVAIPRKTQTRVRIKKLGRAVAIKVAIRRFTVGRLYKVGVPIVGASPKGEAKNRVDRFALQASSNNFERLEPYRR